MNNKELNHTISLDTRQKQFETFVCQNSLPNAEWRAIDGTNRIYYVSNKGRVLSLYGKTALVLKPYLRGGNNCENGYYTVYINGKNRRVHQLVALAFIGKPPDGCIVHHKDGNRLNNELENLQYTTQAQNMIEYFKLKKEQKQKKEEAETTE